MYWKPFYEPMKSPELTGLIVAFAEKAQTAYRGHYAHIRQELSLAGNIYDRHFSASATFGFKLTDVLIRFSGNKMMFLGEQYDYEIHCDAITELKDLGDNSYQFLEVLSERVYRRSTIRFSEKQDTN